MDCLKTYTSSFSYFLVCFLVYVFNISNINAQQKDTSIHQLNEVTISENKQQMIESSKKITKFDSLTLTNYNTSTLADLLSNQSTIHINTYGNGNISTTSMRGGNANHTALLWNGLNIQNAMLGQADLSIIPVLFFNDVSIEYGGGSAMWGSGAIGGSIHLKNKLAFNQGFKTKLQVSKGSFGTIKLNSGILLSYNKIVSNTKLYINQSENNYAYKDTADKEYPNKTVKHANYTSKGLLEELSFLIHPNQKINIRAWYQNTNRHLPSYSSINNNKNQEDENLKLNADWNFTKRNLNSTIRLGYFNDKLNFSDSLKDIFSKSSVKTFITENDNIYQLKNHTLNFGINYTQYNSTLTEKEPSIYSNISANQSFQSTYHHLYKFSLFAAYKIICFNSKIHYNLSIRKEFTSQTYIPITGNTGIQYQLTKHLITKLNFNKSYRQPTLNDLYWNPGGNPNLKPEDGYEMEGGLEYRYTKNHFGLSMEATYFNRHTKNWIIWLPNKDNIWSPKNIAEVYSRGTETKTELSYLNENLLIKMILSTSYILSTYQKTNGENDNSVGRQLIFTPRYNGQASLLIKYKHFNFLFNSNYTGYRFTATDNSSWLNPYYISNFKCSYSYSINTVNTELFCNINNLFNKTYVIISNNPMPLRNYEIGISLTYQKTKKEKLPTN